MKTRTIKTVENEKLHNQRLTNASVYGLVPRIKNDKVIADDFQGTIAMAQQMDAANGGKKCKSCELNKSNDLLLSFVAEFKRCPQDKRPVVENLLGERQWMSHRGKWINVVTNFIEDIKYAEKQIPVTQPVHIPNSPLPPPQVVVSEDPPAPEPEKSEPVKVTDPVVEKKVTENKTVPSSTVNEPKKYIFKNFQAPGDIVMMTAAIRDLHVNFPGKYLTDVRTNSMPIWESNKYITKLNENDPDVVSVDLEYNLIHQSNQGPFHFSEGFTEHLEEVLGVRIKRRIGRGYIEMGPNEEGWGRGEREGWFSGYGYDSETQFWIINAGHKKDFTCKMWPEKRYQEVVDHFQGKILFVQIGHKDHIHPNLDGVVNLVGKTDDRQLIRLVWASSGVLTPCSYPMVLAAAVPVRPGACNGRKNRPCVVVAGGREPSGWQAHTEHQFIHTCGMLPCCDSGGCWASRIKPIGDGDDKDKRNMCKHVVTIDDNGVDLELPYCMDMITSEEVIRRIEMYYSFYNPGRKKTHSHNQR